MYPDTVDKIVQSYFAAVTARAFTYKRVRYPVPRLRISPLLLRGYTCPPDCGGCCGIFTLDYLPGETHPAGGHVRSVVFDGRAVPLYTIEPVPADDHRCRMLDRSNGRCTIHGHHPFSCDFELIRTQHRREKAEVTLTSQLYGRGWAMKRTGGGQGALCEMLPATPRTSNDVLRKLGRLQQWAHHFGLPTRLPQVMSWVAAHVDDPDSARALVLEGR